MDSFEASIVLIADPSSEVDSSQRALLESGYKISHFSSPRDINAEAVLNTVSLVLLEASDDACLWVESFRSKESLAEVPILMFCREMGPWLEGVSDYLVWPCETKVLFARIRPYVELAQSRSVQVAPRCSEASYREIFNASSNAIFIHDCETGQILSVNKTFESMYGFTCEEAAEVTPQICSSGESPYTESHARKWMHKAVHEGPQVFKWHARRKDGSLFWCDVSLRTIEIEDKTRIMAIVQDITQRQNTEQSLVEYRDKLRSLAREMAISEERQRRYIASCLHDGACQDLALAILKLQTFQASLGGEFGLPLTDVVGVLREVVRDLRDLTFDLSPPVLYMSGLSSAVEELLEDQFGSDAHIKVHYSSSHKKLRLSEELRCVLYQCIRELIVNTIKHAHATEVSVILEKQDHSIQVAVKDNGAGFDVDQARMSFTRDSGFGLFNVAERLDYIGGTFEMNSDPGKGSCFMIVAPC